MERRSPKGSLKHIAQTGRLTDDTELRRRVLNAFRLSVALDRNTGQIRVKALISSTFTKSRDLPELGR